MHARHHILSVPKAILLFAAGIVIYGCTTLSPQSARVRHVEQASALEGCQSLGKVIATRPYGLPDDWRDQLRNETAALGGNTVYAESPAFRPGNIDGEAFACPAIQTSRR